MYQIFTASKVAFNTPLTKDLKLNLLYWGPYLRYCGTMQNVNWMPGYYEAKGYNVRRLPYYLASLGQSVIYYYYFDIETVTANKNQPTGNTITTLANKIGYNELSTAQRELKLQKITWVYT
jgi:hypothetical protein